MDWNNVFNDYIDIKSDSKIYSFCNDGEWFLELKHIFLHKSKSEMFILIDVTDKIFELFSYYNIAYDANRMEYSKEQYEILLKKIIKNWENAVLNYLNFEWEDDQLRNIIKYNVTLIILCCKRNNDNEILDNYDSVINEEHSTSICRKIFMFNENDYKDELNYIPFYFEDIKTNSLSNILKLEADLKGKIVKANNFLDEISTYLEEVKNDNN